MQGYDPFVSTVQVKDNSQTQINTKLSVRSNNHVAWAQVGTDPAGAEVFVDGNSTGRFTPARVEIPSGMHTVTLKLEGFQVAKRRVSASEGGTVTINESLRK
jgi:hypothetical protein